MGKNKSGGNKAKKGKNNRVKIRNIDEIKLNDVAFSEGERYGRVDKIYGNLHYAVICYEGTDSRGQKIQCVCRNVKKRKAIRGRINIGDIVLVQIRLSQNHKGDMILRYTPEEVLKLKKIGEIKDTMFNYDYGNSNSDSPNNAQNVVFEDL